MDFLDSVNVGCGSKVHLSAERDFDHLFGGLGHYLFNTRQNDVFLSGSFEELSSINADSSRLGDDVNEVVFSFFLPLA
jgi:hypothetical protein